MLYIKTKDAYELWNGEPINGVRHPKNIESVWSKEDLEAAGFHIVDLPVVPNGQKVTDQAIVEVEGKPVVEYTLVEESPADFPLTARQLRLGLIRNGIPLSTVINAIAGIQDELQRDEAQVYWEYSTHIRWEHPMTQALIAIAGIKQADAAAMWLVARNYEV